MTVEQNLCSLLLHTSIKGRNNCHHYKLYIQESNGSVNIDIIVERNGSVNIDIFVDSHLSLNGR
jgi:hypothetical protein